MRVFRAAATILVALVLSIGSASAQTVVSSKNVKIVLGSLPLAPTWGVNVVTRAELWKKYLPNVEIDVFRELVVDFAHRWDAKAIVKGLRVMSDFEWEFQMNQLNRTLAPEIETVYVMASPAVSFVSSSGVKEIASFGGNVEELVPKAVAARLKEMFPNGRGGAPLSDQE